jgi:hypothetical protein
MTFPTSALVATMLVASFCATLPAQTPASAQKTACAPPPEWDATKTFGNWHVGKSCQGGVVDLSVSAEGSGAGQSSGFMFICNNEGAWGMFSLNKINLNGPLSVTLKGGQTPALSLNGIGGDVATTVEIEASEAKRFEAALVDGTGSTFTIVLTQRGKPPLELTFPRTGLAAAVKPLRSKCGW